MVSLEIKALSTAHLLQKNVIIFIVVEFICSGTCFPRLVDKNYEVVERKPSSEILGNAHPKHNHFVDGPAWSLKTKHFSGNMLDAKDENIKNDYERGFKISQKHLDTHSRNEKSQVGRVKDSFMNGGVNAHDFTISNGRVTNEGLKEPFVNRQQRHHDVGHGFDDDWNLSHEEKYRTDDQSHDENGSSHLITNEKIMDYFFNNDARDSDSRRKLRHQGVIINLRGLIPYEDAVVERFPSSTTDREVKNGNGDELLAFKAFEIDSSPQPDSMPTSDDEDEGPSQAIDISKVTSRVDFIDESEIRNLSRKRRQRASPNVEEAEDEEQSRRRFFRRRRRKRKRRHRHSRHHDDVMEEGDVPKHPFSLKSHGPDYVITSAKELKKDWCRTVPLKQRIEEKNCKPKIIFNNFCYGQCNSFFIPHQGRTGNGAAFQSCAFCKPNKQRWVNVTLHCPGEEPNRVEKKILLVESCRCMTEILH